MHSVLFYNEIPTLLGSNDAEQGFSKDLKISS